MATTTGSAEVGSGPLPTNRSGGRLLFPTAVAIVNVAIFLFQIMAARITTPALFGELVALLCVMLILEAPASTFQVLLCRAVQRRRESSTEGASSIDIGPLAAISVTAGVAVCAVLLPLMPVLGGFLHLRHPPWLVAAYAIPVTMAVVPKGVLAGLADFRAVSIGMVVSAVVRLGAGTALLHSGFGISGALGAVVVGEAIGGLILLAAARRRTGAGGEPLDFLWRDALGEGLAFTGFWVLTGIDVVMARHYLPRDDAGEYAAAATLAQLVMILPAVASAFLSPRFVTLRTSTRASSTLTRSLVFVGFCSAIIGTGARLFDVPVLDAVFDVHYRFAAVVAAPVLASAAVVGLITVLQQYLVARGEIMPAASLWVGIGVFLGAVAYAHRSMTAIADEMLLITIATCLVMLAVALHGIRYLPRTNEPRPALADLDAEIDLTIVVPYYNPGSTLAPHLRRLLDVLENSPVDFEVIAVSDGSTDGSDATVSGLGSDRLHQVVLPQNQGKGAALRVGLSAGRGRYLGFIDADGDLDPKLLANFMTLVSLYEPDVVIGSKRHPLSEVRYPPLRWVYSVGFQYLVKVLFRLNIRDTQTGLKLVRRDVLAASLPRMLEKRFAFDLELLVVARRLGYRRFLEAPVILRHQFKSTVSIRAVWHTLWDTLAIFYRLRFLRTYDRTARYDPSQFRPVPTLLRGGVGLKS